VVAVDGHDAKAINKAIEEAKAVTDKPSLICCKTTIGFGSPNLAGTHDCHGAPLGDEEIAATRKQLGWDHVAFEIPADVYEGWDHKAQGVTDESTWNDKFSTYKAEFPAEAAEFERRMAGELPANFAGEMDKFIAKTQGEMPNIASRQASQNAIEAMGPLLPEIWR
jgi:transketolase